MVKKYINTDITASDLLDTLQNTIYPKEAYAMLREVRNSTGYVKKERYADAIVMSLYPSRGLWLAGIEVKVNRYDWLNELKNVEKSDPIQKYCDYWNLVTLPNIIEEGELPVTWGHIEIIDGKSKVKVQAPNLESAPLDKSFVASVLRNEAKKLEQKYQEGKKYAEDNFVKENKEELNNVEKLESKIFEIERELQRNKLIKNDIETRKNNLEIMLEKIREETGISFWDTRYTDDYIKILKLSEFLVKNKEMFDNTIDNFEKIVNSLKEIKKLKENENT